MRQCNATSQSCDRLVTLLANPCCSQKIVSCHSRGKEHLHEHTTGNGLELPPAFGFVSHRSGYLIIMERSVIGNGGHGYTHARLIFVHLVKESKSLCPCCFLCLTFVTKSLDCGHCDLRIGHAPVDEVGFPCPPKRKTSLFTRLQVMPEFRVHPAGSLAPSPDVHGTASVQRKYSRFKPQSVTRPNIKTLSMLLTW